MLTSAPSPPLGQNSLRDSTSKPGLAVHAKTVAFLPEELTCSQCLNIPRFGQILANRAMPAAPGRRWTAINRVANQRMPLMSPRGTTERFQQTGGLMAQMASDLVCASFDALVCLAKGLVLLRQPACVDAYLQNERAPVILLTPACLQHAHVLTFHINKVHALHHLHRLHCMCMCIVVLMQKTDASLGNISQ